MKESMQVLHGKYYHTITRKFKSKNKEQKMNLQYTFQWEWKKKWKILSNREVDSPVD